MKSSTLLIEKGALFRISREVDFKNPGRCCCKQARRHKSQQISQTHVIEPTSSDLVEHLHELLRSLQRSGRLIARRVLPRVSAGLREAIADPAPAVESV